mgnify:CR=1 FL=1
MVIVFGIDLVARSTVVFLFAIFSVLVGKHAGAGSEFDNQVPSIPDRIFYPFRQGIVSGALAHLYMMPGKDWTNPQLAQPHGAKFENTIADAKSRADRDFGNAPLTTKYGGI